MYYDATVPDPDVAGAVFGLSDGRVAFSNPSSTTHRENMTLRIGTLDASQASGITWDRGMVLAKSATEAAGYSSIFEGSDGKVGVLWETQGDDAFPNCYGGYCQIVLTLVTPPASSKAAATRTTRTTGAADNYVRYSTGWSINPTGTRNLNFSCAAVLPQPSVVLSHCDTNPLCLAVNAVPVQPDRSAGINASCVFYKALNESHLITQVFLHRTRCNAQLNATTVTSPNNQTYKFCPHVGDASFTHLEIIWGVTSWEQCMQQCDADARCSACQTDGASCETFTTYTSAVCGTTAPGCSAWFKLDY